MLSRKCSFCDSRDVVLISGYNYCINCAKSLDRAWIINTLLQSFPAMTATNINNICVEMFGSKDFCFSMFPVLYSIIDRGPWLDKDRKFKISQDDYITMVFRKYLEVHHPKFFDRIAH